LLTPGIQLSAKKLGHIVYLSVPAKGGNLSDRRNPA
jgi:hypothetical protein